MRARMCLAVSGVIIFVACSGSSGSTTIADAGAIDGSSGSSGDDGGTKEAGAGCIAEILNAGTSATSVARAGVTGAAAWQTPASALAADGAPTKAELGAGDETETLIVTGFGFSPPAGMRIAGVEVELKREGPGGDVTDGSVVLVLGAQTSPTSHYVANAWPTTIFGTHLYGDVDDLWGMTLAPSDIASPTFGVSLYVKRLAGATSAPVALVDSLRMTVTYCPT